MKKQIVALMALVTFGLSSCNKDDDRNLAEDRPKTRVEILTEKSWNIESVKVTEESEHGSSEYEIPMPGTVTFNKDNTVLTRIPGEEDQVSVWALSDAGLNVDGELYTVVELTETKLALYQEVTEEDEELGEITYTTLMKMSR